jgi:hypothetical protein
MHLQLVRESFTDKATEGKLFVNGQFECYTLEDQDKFLESGGLKIVGDTCIPRGTYEVKLTMSNRFRKTLPLLYRCSSVQWHYEYIVVINQKILKDVYWLEDRI